MLNPLLDPTTLPPFRALQPDAISAALDEGLARYEAVVGALVEKKAATFETLWLPLERIETELEALWSAVSHLKAVTNDPALREAHAAGAPRLIEASTRVRQNVELYGLLKALSQTGLAGRSEGDRAALAHLLREFELSGVALAPAERERFAALMAEQSTLATAFANAVVDATDAWSEHVTAVSDLAGVPETSLGMFAAAARAQGLDGWLVTLQQPSVQAILMFAQNRGLRERVYRAFGTRASDQGPHAGQFDNSARIQRLMEIRKEAADLLGFASPATLSLATKMADDPAQVLAFLRDLGARAKPAADQELETVKAYAAEALGLADFQPWDLAYASEQLRASRYDVDAAEVRAYFPVEQVLKGWKALLKDLYGVTLVARDDVDLWSKDAVYYDLVDETGTVLAGLITDLHARPGKQGGAWMAPARPRLNDGSRQSKPVAYMVCNFDAKRDDGPSLLSHYDIVTLLHETGHCLHHLFTLVERPSIAGVNGFEWDAVELPSQLMEDFAWVFDILQSMSSHVETGATLPRALFDKLLAARQFQSSLGLVRQLEFALFDMLLHEGRGEDDVMSVLALARSEVAAVIPPDWHRFPHAFTHVFANSYWAGYYSYLWAEVLAADGFQTFADMNHIDRPTADRFRAEVLARGASRPAAESFRAFQGRDPDPTALLARRGLAA